MNQIYDIAAACGHNLGGIHRLRVIPVRNIPVRNIRSMPAPSMATAWAGVYGLPAVYGLLPVLRDPEDQCEIWFANGAFTETMQEDANGEFYRQQIQVYAPKDSPEAAAATSALTGVRCVCVYTDGNGLVKLVGTDEHPLTFGSELDTGSDAGDKNGLKLRFTGESVLPALLLPPENAPPPLAKAFSGGFSSGFLQDSP